MRKFKRIYDGLVVTFNDEGKGVWSDGIGYPGPVGEIAGNTCFTEIFDTPAVPAKPKPVRVRRFKEDVQRDLTKAEMRIHQLECELKEHVGKTGIAIQEHSAVSETLRNVEALYRAQTKVLDNMTVWTLVKRWFRRG